MRDGNIFRFYFAQQEAIESIIYLFEVAEARDKYELIIPILNRFAKKDLTPIPSPKGRGVTK